MMGERGSRVVLAGVVVLLTAACTVGKRDLPLWAEAPAGAVLEVEFDGADLARLTGETTHQNGGALRGELLSVQSDGLLLWSTASDGDLPWLRESNLLLLEYSALRFGRVREYDPRKKRHGRTFGTASPLVRQQLTRWARYPGPLGDERIDAIREAMDQPRVVRVALPGAGESAPGDPAAAAAPTGSVSNEDLASFLERTRDAAERFRDRRVAIREGYRRLGPDFPGMGEHWVHPGRAVSGEVRPEQPPVLSYLPVDGEPLLTGVAWTVPLAPGESPPTTPLGDTVWHDHSGSLDEEALLLDSPRSHAHAHEEEGPRLSMVHAWLWVPNPDGMLAQNNWALPFVRSGLAVPDEVCPEVARALSLAGSGLDYYRTLLTRASRAEGADLQVIDHQVTRASRAVDAAIADARDWDAVGEIWTRLWVDLERNLSPRAWAALREAAAVWGVSAERPAASPAPHG